METTVYAVGNQSTREVAGWLVGFPYCVSELSDTENQNELTGWPVQATLISELGTPVVKCRQGHPHAEGDGKTVGHLERQLAFSIGFRKNERVTVLPAGPVWGLMSWDLESLAFWVGSNQWERWKCRRVKSKYWFPQLSPFKVAACCSLKVSGPLYPEISSSDPSFFLLLQAKSSICSPRLLIYPGSCVIRGQFPLNGPCKILFLLTPLAYQCLLAKTLTHFFKSMTG